MVNDLVWYEQEQPEKKDEKSFGSQAIIFSTSLEKGFEVVPEEGRKIKIHVNSSMWHVYL